MLLRQKLNAFRLPLQMHFIRRAGNDLVGAHTVEAAHKDIPENNGVHALYRHRNGNLEARICLKPGNVQRNYRNLRVPRLCQRAADKADIVAGAAAAARLCDNNSRL